MNSPLAFPAAPLFDTGFCFIPGERTRSLIGGTPLDWRAFEASWSGMPLDTYMADGGRYRRRRHATLRMPAGSADAIREPHQPHYQSRDYNALNGGIARLYEPIAAEVIEGATMKALLALGAETFGRLAPGIDWHVEVHQFRIEASQGNQGQPTPEGVHRDGVDYVMVMMVKRHNIREGVTTIHDHTRRQIASFTLIDPFDLTLVDDHRCMHGVTPVVPQDPAQPAYRDVLVVTFRAR